MVSSRTAVVALLACNVAQAFVAPSAAHKLARPLDAKAKGGFGAAPSAKTEKKKPKKDEGPALARPWDNDGDDDDSKKTRNERRGGKGKSGKKGEGGAAIANPSGGMAAGVKLK